MSNESTKPAVIREGVAAAPGAASIAAPFVGGLELHEVRYQRCAGCGAAQTLARYACFGCGDARLEWQRSAGHGVVYSTTVVSRAPSDEFRAIAPYTLVIVELDEGPRLMGHATPGVAIGDPVAADFFEFAGRTLLRFRPAK